MSKKTYDFGGWASEYGVLCGDGRTILSGAFADQDGAEVPLVWGHDHSGPKSILGFATIKHCDKGPYIYGSFNDTEDGQYAKAAVNHGDIKFLSIFADHLKTRGINRDVEKGVIKEVSLVPFGAANPGAYIDQAVIAHGDGTYSESEYQAYITTGQTIDVGEDLIIHDDKGKEKDVAEDTKKKGSQNDDDDSIDVQEVLDNMTEDQLAVVDYLMEEAAKAATKDSKKGTNNSDDDDESDDDNDDGEDGDGKETVAHSDEGGTMKYNAFENDSETRKDVLMHSDQAAILELAKDRRVGSFRTAMKEYMEENDFIQHDDTPTFVGGNTVVGGPVPVGGFDNTTAIDSRGYTSFTSVLPEFREFNGMNPPQQITPEWGWVDNVMNKVHKVPFSRIRTSYIDIREYEEQLRAKGYEKGNYKTYTGQIAIARRETEPQTIYIKNALHKDDITDITDFDYVNYLYQIDQQMYKVEVATAILFGDGREANDPDKIKEDHIRPIWTDADLYTIHYDMTNEKSNIQGSNTSGYFGANYVEAEAMVNACLYARETYKGTGTPDMFIDQHDLNVMLLARDRNGRRIYSSRAELATALNVGSIYVCEKMKNKIRTKGEGASAKQMKLHAIIANLADYAIGATKGGQVTHITQFDIDFNQQKSLLEGRCSGALSRLYSAIVIEEEVTSSFPSNNTESETDTEH